MMKGARATVLDAIGSHADRQAQQGRRARQERHLRQARVPEPGRLDEGPRGDATSSATPSGAGCSGRAARSSRRRQRQHRRRAGAGGRDARLQVHLRHARQDVEREDRRPARVRRQGGHLPDRRRARGSAQLLRGDQAARRGDAELVPREPVPQPGQPRGALRLDGARRSGSRPAARSTSSSPAWAPAARSRAAASYFKEKKPGFQVVGVDPIGSLYYEYVKTGRMTKPFTYYVEGIGEDFLPGDDEPQDHRRDHARRRQGVLPA